RNGRWWLGEDQQFKCWCVSGHHSSRSIHPYCSLRNGAKSGHGILGRGGMASRKQIKLTRDLRLHKCQWMATFFERAASDANTIGGFEAGPDFLAGDLARQQVAVKAKQV